MSFFNSKPSSPSSPTQSTCIPRPKTPPHRQIHLENIRLKKENEALKKENAELHEKILKWNNEANELSQFISSLFKPSS